MNRRSFPLLTLILLSLLSFSACAREESPAATMQAVFTEETTLPATVPVTAEATVLETEPPAPVMAEQITDGYTIRLEGSDVTDALSDNNYSTCVPIPEGKLLTIESSRPFASLSLEWDTLPGSYTLSWEGGSLDFGAEGFLHDYISLPGEVTSVSFHFSEAAPTVCNVGLFTAGDAPADVQDWLPPAEQADILVFPTHSDDDVLFFGAVMSYYAVDTGYTVQTAFMVDHVYEPVRNHERLNGLWELGLRHYPVLHTARDHYSLDLYGAMASFAGDDIRGWQVAQIRRFRPLVVVGHDLQGEYGHGAHKLNAYYLTQSVEMAADPEQYPDSAESYGVWEVPKLYLHLYTENPILFDVNTVLENDPLGRTPFEVAEDAFACHVSQQKTPFRVSQENSATLDCRRFGLYRSLVGADTGGDMMENIQSEDWRNK